MTKESESESSGAIEQHHEKMLRLVAKSFYNELINYGVNQAQVLTVAGHLLDNVMNNNGPAKRPGDYYNQLFTARQVQDEWNSARRLSVHHVSITPFEMKLVPQVVCWLQTPSIREGFYPRFPDATEELEGYFQNPSREYFSIWYEGDLAGLIGAENIDAQAAKLEMRKLVGDPKMHGKGIGKRATFLFLYHVFLIRKFKKVYLHSLDINIRNLNLNAKFGFELEGVFLEEAVVRNQRRDVVRMGLFAPVWTKLFASPPRP